MSDKEFGIPEQKKFPLDTRAHVISAIRFFNYAAPQYRKELAARIIRKIHEYNITGLTPSNQNAFYNYYHPKIIEHTEGGSMNDYVAIDSSDYLEHHGVLGQKWGVRRYQNSNGSLTSAGKQRYAKKIAKDDYRVDRYQRKQEKTNSFRKYRKLDKKIRKTNTKKRQLQSDTGVKLTKAEQNWGHEKVASYRSTSKSIRTGMIVVAGLLGTAATASVAPVVVAAPAAAISAKQIPYYLREKSTYKTNSKKPE